MVEQLRDEIERLRVFREECYLDLKRGIMLEKDYIRQRDITAKQEEAYERQLETLLSKEETEKGRSVLEDSWIQNILQKGEIEYIERDMVIELVEEIHVFEDNRVKIIYRTTNELEGLYNTMQEVSL